MARKESGFTHYLLLAAILVVGGCTAIGYYVYQKSSANGMSIARAAEHPDSLLVTQFNVYIGTSPKEFRNDLDKLMDMKPDAITLNEAMKKSKDSYEIRGYQSYRGTSNEYELEVPVLWDSTKWRMIDQGTTVISRAPDSVVQRGWGNRNASWATLQRRGNPDRVFTIVSTHLTTAPEVHPQVMKESMANLNNLINSKRKLGPVVTGGDFNYDYAVDSKEIRYHYPYFALERSTTRSTYEALGRTETGWGTGDKFKRANGEGPTLDYIFYTYGMNLRPKRHAIIRNLNSDHNAVTALFEFRDKKSQNDKETPTAKRSNGE